MYVMYIYAQIYSSCWSRCVRKCLLTCAWKFYFIYVLWSSIPFHRKPCIFKSLWNWIDCSHPLWVDHPFLNHEPDDGAIGSKPTTKWTVYKLRLKENVHSTISPGFMTLERDSWERFHRIHRIHPGLLRHGVSDVRDSHKSNLQQTVVAFRPIRPMALKNGHGQTMACSAQLRSDWIWRNHVWPHRRPEPASLPMSSAMRIGVGWAIILRPRRTAMAVDGNSTVPSFLLFFSLYFIPQLWSLMLL